jgi:ketosteroid isomerase-like protein
MAPNRHLPGKEVIVDGVTREIHATLERFGELVAARHPDALAQFAPGDATMLVGSEAGEIARGRPAIDAFLQGLFRRPETITWAWDEVAVASAGEVAWAYAEGHVVIRRGAQETRLPYRLTAVFQKIGTTWKWRHFHGSEPA